MLAFVFGFGGSRRDNFAASLMLWWAAASIIDVAPYIWDAYDPKLMLLGGNTGAESDGHDWQNILGDLGLIRRAHLIADFAHARLLTMLAAYAWGAALLYLSSAIEAATCSRNRDIIKSLRRILLIHVSTSTPRGLLKFAARSAISNCGARQATPPFPGRPHAEMASKTDRHAPKPGAGLGAS